MGQPPSPIFRSILCGADNSASGVAARRHAMWLAEGDSVVEVVPARTLTRLEREPLRQRCGAHDLLVLPAETDVSVTADAGIPVLLAGRCPEGKDVTDDVLVAVGDQPGATRAAQLAARLAARHRGSVSIVAAPRPSRALDRAIAAGSRIVLSTMGSAPRLLGELDPPERAVAKAVIATGATLLVLAVDDSPFPALATDVARSTACSVLAVPAPAPAPGRFLPAERSDMFARDAEPAFVR
jgi:hypothetical protein